MSDPKTFFQTVTGSEKMLARYDGTIEGDASSSSGTYLTLAQK